MMPPPAYAIIHRLSVEDGYGNTPHVLCQEAPCTEYETRYYSSHSVCPFFAITRLGFHLDTPRKIEHTFDRLYEILIHKDAVHWHLRWDDGCWVLYGPLLWYTPNRLSERGDMRLKIGLLRREKLVPVTSKATLQRQMKRQLARRQAWT